VKTPPGRRSSARRRKSSTPGTAWTREITGYPVTVAQNALDRVGAIVSGAAAGLRYVIITDHTVRDLYGARVAASFGASDVSVLAIPAGEAQKTRDTWGRLTDQLLSAGHGRDSVIVALGGGVVGDLAGFVAATFMRGIPFVQVPTTLLAMIDASIGGKTGVDTTNGKNLVGAFHRPAAVVIDPLVLSTLPPREMRAGLAEAIKHGVIADDSYFAAIERAVPAIAATPPDFATIHDLIVRSIEIKGEVVERDEREAGLRKVLNFGHTIGHAVETLSGYSFLHGECIALGMALEAEVGERAGITAKGTADGIRRVLRAATLPVDRPRHMEPQRIIEVARGDKKARAGMIELAIPLALGRMAGEDSGWTIRIGEGLITEVLEECAEAG
jgi:3-dehydroquinate synthase